MHRSAARVPHCPRTRPLSTHPLELAEVAQHVLHHLAHVPAVQQQRLLQVLHLQARQSALNRQKVKLHKQASQHRAIKPQKSVRGQAEAQKGHARARLRRTSFGSRFSRMRRALLDRGLIFLASSAACMVGVFRRRKAAQHGLPPGQVCSQLLVDTYTSEPKEGPQGHSRRSSASRARCLHRQQSLPCSRSLRVQNLSLQRHACSCCALQLGYCVLAGVVR